MLKVLPVAIASVLYFQVAHAGEKPLSFCTKGGCEEKNCPVSIATSGKGYPSCVIYDSDDIFPGQGFPTSSGGSYSPFINVEQPNDGCTMMIKSPANTDEEGCGKLVGSFKDATCTHLDIKKTFMVQYCCGNDCKDAGDGVKRSAKFRRTLDSRSGGAYLHYPNGTVIPPSQESVMKMPGAASENTKRSTDDIDLVPRKDKGKCKDWKADSDLKRDPYTKPSEKTDTVRRGAPSGADVQISETRSQSWTHGSDISLSVADIIGFGTSISESFTEEKSDSSSYTFHVPKGQDGDIAFTATMKCTRGTGKCDGEDFKGEICEPWVENDKLVGEYTVVVHS